MIAITDRSTQGLTAMAELALGRDGESLSVPELARRCGVNVALLEQLLPALRRAGLVESRRGVKGGYTLARAAGEITALNVVEAIEGELRLPDDRFAPWAEVVGGLREKLAEFDLATLAQQRSEASGGPMYYI
ncbi:MAG: Rrf2 family transcriptional regulator [Thermoleophilaceae bacterium]|nr:Rrf2 family transcriptional regulator [Thermoleophilaceae bacterium]